jgi:hypothetical protein
MPADRPRRSHHCAAGAGGVRARPPCPSRAHDCAAEVRGHLDPTDHAAVDEVIRHYYALADELSADSSPTAPGAKPLTSCLGPPAHCHRADAQQYDDAIVIV